MKTKIISIYLLAALSGPAFAVQEPKISTTPSTLTDADPIHRAKSVQTELELIDQEIAELNTQILNTQSAQQGALGTQDANAVARFKAQSEAYEMQKATLLSKRSQLRAQLKSQQ